MRSAALANLLSEITEDPSVLFLYYAGVEAPHWILNYGSLQIFPNEPASGIKESHSPNRDWYTNPELGLSHPHPWPESNPKFAILVASKEHSDFLRVSTLKKELSDAL